MGRGVTFESEDHSNFDGIGTYWDLLFIYTKRRQLTLFPKFLNFDGLELRY